MTIAYRYGQRTRIVIALGAASLLAASCAVSFTQIRGPEGKPAYVMNCNGLAVTKRDCAHLARRLCPRGYHLVDERSMAAGADARRYRTILQNDYVMISCN
jgi:hypothetical protein